MQDQEIFASWREESARRASSCVSVRSACRGDPFCRQYVHLYSNYSGASHWCAWSHAGQQHSATEPAGHDTSRPVITVGGRRSLSGPCGASGRRPDIRMLGALGRLALRRRAGAPPCFPPVKYTCTQTRPTQPWGWAYSSDTRVRAGGSWGGLRSMDGIGTRDAPPQLLRGNYSF